MLTRLLRPRKRKREGEDEHDLRSKAAPTAALVEGEESALVLNKNTLVTASSNTAVLPASVSSSTADSSKLEAALPSSTVLPNNAPLPIGKGINIGLTKLYEPKDPSSALVDIVFVHGLTGNAYSTWLYKDKKTEVYWPYGLLRKDYPDARILAFGYDADITQFWGPASSNRVSNHAENMLGSLSRLRARTDTV
jgi:hypothetical protein